MAKIAAIHQPNFFPWLGYFDKIVRSDIFIFLDDVQFSKKGGTWSNRMKLKVAQESKWMTAAVDRSYQGTRLVSEMRFQEDTRWKDKLLRTMEQSYSKAPFFEDGLGFFSPLIFNNESCLATYNSSAILAIAKRLGISREKFEWSSRLIHEGQSNQLLASLTRAVDCDTYMCGGGAEGYQDEDFFENAGIQLLHQEFRHPEYPQVGGAFQAGLSVIDAFMNIGENGVRQILGLTDEVWIKDNG